MTARTIRKVNEADAGPLAAIYNHYILNSTATFEESPLAPQTIAKRITQIEAANLPWLVAETGGGITGYAYACPWKNRSAYRHSAETTVYVAPDKRGCGTGGELYGVLLDQLHQSSLRVAMGGIALPNAASIALHERLGFVKVAHFSEVGYKFGHWIDVGYWQIKLS